MPNPTPAPNEKKPQMPTPSDMPPVGIPQTLAPQIARVIAPNASPMTYWGTNSYLVGTTSLVVIDPGPNDIAHLEALESAINGRDVAAIFVTHSHLDHSPLAPILAESVGAQVYGFGPSTAGRSARMQALALEANVAGGEGVDHTFAPDVTLLDNQSFKWPDGTITALHTPGHFCNHMCFHFGDVLFSGDHIMEWASTLISPPDGDLTQYRASIERLRGIGITRMFAGHGDPVDTPESRMADLLTHRNMREAQFLAVLTQEPQSVQQITAQVYYDTPTPLLFAAARNTFAHLIDLYDKKEIDCDAPLSIGSHFKRN